MLPRLCWDTEHKLALEIKQVNLSNTANSSFPEEDHVLLVYTDASEKFWDVVIGFDQDLQWANRPPLLSRVNPENCLTIIVKGRVC